MKTATRQPCAVCGESPTLLRTLVTHRGNGGRGVAEQQSEPLCRDHGLDAAKRHLAATVRSGWRGVPSVVSALRAAGSDLAALDAFRQLDGPGQSWCIAGANWYADPKHRHQFRYFDGLTWTAQVSDNGVVSVDPLLAEPLQPIPARLRITA